MPPGTCTTQLSTATNTVGNTPAAACPVPTNTSGTSINARTWECVCTPTKLPLSHTPCCPVYVSVCVNPRTRDDAVEGAALVVQRLALLAHALLPRAQRPEVLRRLGHHVLVQLKHHLANCNSKSRNKKGCSCMHGGHHVLERLEDHLAHCEDAPLGLQGGYR